MRVEDRIEVANNGYNYVKVQPQECFAWGGACICNGCGRQIVTEPMNLCYVLGDLYCDECFNRILDYPSEEYELARDIARQEEDALTWYKAYLEDSDTKWN